MRSNRRQLLLIAFGSLSVCRRRVGYFAARVVKLIDGDTIDVLAASQLMRLRLNGVDCPERKQPYFKDGCGSFALEARALFFKWIAVVRGVS